MLSDTRRMYDLCRKYKYYYNAYHKIKNLEEVYWSKYIIDAVDEVKKQLEECEDEIIFIVFNELLGEEFDIEVECIVDDGVFNYWDEYCMKPRVIGEKISIYDEKFNRKLKEYADKIIEKKIL